MTLKKRRAVGYVRVSRVGGRSGDSFLTPDVQREQIKGVARREGLTIVEVIDELDAGLHDVLARAWILPLVGAVGILVAITLDVDPIHDIGVFVFEGAWVALGIARLRTERQLEAGDAASALV